MRSVVAACCVVLFLSVFTSSCVDAKIWDLYPSNSTWQTILGGLQPGDIANLHSGTYSYSNGFQIAISGTSSQPITIRGAPGETRPIFDQTNINQNIWNIDGGEYLIVQDIEMNGGSEGIRLGPNNPVTNSKFYNLLIHDTQSTGFTANFPSLEYVNLTIEHNEVYNTGTGSGECFYMGCTDGGCLLRDSVIKNNYCHDTLQANGGSEGSGIQVKKGSYNNVIQDNVCYNTKGTCVLVYDDFDRGRNRIIGNLVLNSQDNGIQATAGADIINNIIFNIDQNGISIQNTNDLAPGKPFRNITIIHNTIVNTTNSNRQCLYLSGVDPANSWVIANNALYCPLATQNILVNPYNGSPSDLTDVTVEANVYLGGTVPAGISSGGVTESTGEFDDMLDPSSSGLNVYPTSTGLLPGNGVGGSSLSVSYDYNGNSRSSTAPTIGAYEYSTASNPGAALGPGFKPSTSPTTSTTSNPGSTSPASSFKVQWLKKLGLTHLL